MRREDPCGQGRSRHTRSGRESRACQKRSGATEGDPVAPPVAEQRWSAPHSRSEAPGRTAPHLGAWTVIESVEIAGKLGVTLARRQRQLCGRTHRLSPSTRSYPLAIPSARRRHGPGWGPRSCGASARSAAPRRLKLSRSDEMRWRTSTTRGYRHPQVARQSSGAWRGPRAGALCAHRLRRRSRRTRCLSTVRTAPATLSASISSKETVSCIWTAAKGNPGGHTTTRARESAFRERGGLHRWPRCGVGATRSGVPSAV